MKPKIVSDLCSNCNGDYDAVIIGHSQLEKIPVSAERQERMIRRQINEITEGEVARKVAECKIFSKTA